MKKIFISAGEVSGDWHAASLVRAIRKTIPDVEFWGIGREKLGESGVKLVAYMGEYDIVGIDGILKKTPYFYSLTKKIISRALDTSLAIFVDYPGYNILLARYFNNIGIKNIYYIAPQVWGWWQFRAKLVARYIDTALVIYPFEVDFWKRFGMNAVYVGNPVYDAIFQGHIEPIHPLPEGKKIIGLLPGSRYSEVKRVLPYMLRIKKLIEKKYKDVHFLLSLVPENIEVQKEENLAIIRGEGKRVMKSSDVLIVSSGTATLEGALLEKPMVVLYALSPLSYFLGRMVKRVEYLSLVNIVAGREVVKEFIQDIDVYKVAEEVEHLLFDKDRISEIKQGFLEIKSKLSGNASFNAASFIKRRFFNGKDD